MHGPEVQRAAAARCSRAHQEADGCESAERAQAGGEIGRVPTRARETKETPRSHREPLRPEPQLEWRSSPDQHTVRRALDEADGVIEGMNEVVAVRQDEHGTWTARRCSWVVPWPTKTP